MVTSLDRFMAKVEPVSSGCWRWTAATTNAGYGKFKDAGRDRLAHRWAYETLIGPIPAGLQLDHLCHNRWCVNPTHVEPVTARTNLMRSPTLQAINAAKTHCVAGHPLDGANLMRSSGRRYCRICKAARDASWRSAHLVQERRRDREAKRARRAAA